MEITRRSQLSGVVHTRWISVTVEQLNAYNAGALAQVAFPHLNSDDREFIMTGITKEEWEAAFGS